MTRLKEYRANRIVARGTERPDVSKAEQNCFIPRQTAGLAFKRGIGGVDQL